MSLATGSGALQDSANNEPWAVQHCRTALSMRTGEHWVDSGGLQMNHGHQILLRGKALAATPANLWQISSR